MSFEQVVPRLQPPRSLNRALAAAEQAKNFSSAGNASGSQYRLAEATQQALINKARAGIPDAEFQGYLASLTLEELREMTPHTTHRLANPAIVRSAEDSRN